MNVVHDLIASLKLAKGFEDAFGLLSQLAERIGGFRAPDRLREFRYQGYEFHVCIPSTFAALRQNLVRCHELGIHAAPRLYKAIKFPSGDGCVVTCIEGLEQGELLSYEDDDTAPYYPLAIAQLGNDLLRLGAAGLYHPYAICQGHAHWWVHPQTGRLFLDRWEIVRPITESEADNLEREISPLLRLPIRSDRA